MISRTVDTLTSRYPKLAEYCKNRIYCFFGTTDGRNIAVFLTSGITAGILAGADNDVIKYAAIAVNIIVWLQTSVLAGFMKQWLYIAVTAMYFMLPNVFVIRPETVEAAQATQFQYTISDIMQAVPLKIMRLAAGDGDVQVISIAAFAACLVLFFAGLRLRNTAKRSDFYCRTRLEQLK